MLTNLYSTATLSSFYLTNLYNPREPNHHNLMIKPRTFLNLPTHVYIHNSKGYNILHVSGSPLHSRSRILSFARSRVPKYYLSRPRRVFTIAHTYIARLCIISIAAVNPLLPALSRFFENDALRG